MECHNHPDREAVANCAFCGKAVCPECSMEIGGNIYCKDCINEIIIKSFGEKEAKEDIAPKETMTKEPAEVFEPIEPITPIQAEERKLIMNMKQNMLKHMKKMVLRIAITKILTLFLNLYQNIGNRKENLNHKLNQHNRLLNQSTLET